MVDEPRYAEIGRQLITEFNACEEQGGRAELFAVRRSAVPEAVLQSAPETAIGEDTATPPEQVLEQRDPPGEAEIAVVGFARSVERTAEMGPRRADHAKEFRRGEQHLEIDVRTRFDGLVEQSDVMGEDTEFELVDQLGLRCRRSRDSGDQHSGNNHGAKHSHHYRYSRSAFTAHLISRNQLIDFSPDANPPPRAIRLRRKRVERLPARRPAVAVELAPDNCRLGHPIELHDPALADMRTMPVK